MPAPRASCVACGVAKDSLAATGSPTVLGARLGATVCRLGAKRRLVQGLVEGRPRGRDRPDAALGQVEAHARVVGEVVVDIDSGQSVLLVT